MKELEKLLKENSGLLSRMKERDGDEKLNEICEEIFKKELTATTHCAIIITEREKEDRKMDKAERLATIMFEEDTHRIEEEKEPIYFTKEDYEAEKAERIEK